MIRHVIRSAACALALGAAAAGSAPDTASAQSEPVAVTFFNADFFANDPHSVRTILRQVDFRARVNTFSVQVDVRDSTPFTDFAIEAFTQCLGEEGEASNLIGDSPVTAADDLVHLCPFSRGETLIGAVGILD